MKSISFFSQKHTGNAQCTSNYYRYCGNRQPKRNFQFLIRDIEGTTRMSASTDESASATFSAPVAK